MANTIVEFEATQGQSLTVLLYPYESDIAVNGAGDAATESTNRKGVYSVTVTEALSGYHHAIVEDAGGDTIESYHVYLLDDTAIHRCGHLAVIGPEAGNLIADHMLKRNQINVEDSLVGDTLDIGSMYGTIQQAQNFSPSSSDSSALEVFQTDGVTSLGVLSLVTDSEADPIRGIS